MAIAPENEEPTLSIGAVSKESGLPASTVRYYCREFEGYLRVQKTGGGHRRFFRDDLEKLMRIHRWVHEERKSIQEVRARLVSDRDPAILRRDLDLLLEVFEALVQENTKLRKAVQDLADRIVTLEEKGKKKRFSLFSG